MRLYCIHFNGIYFVFALDFIFTAFYFRLSKFTLSQVRNKLYISLKRYTGVFYKPHKAWSEKQQPVEVYVT